MPFPYDLNRDAAGKTQRGRFFDRHLHLPDAPVLEADLGHALRQALQQLKRGRFHHGDDILFDRLVVHRVRNAVRAASQAQITVQDNIDDDILLFAALFRIDAHDAPQTQVNYADPVK